MTTSPDDARHLTFTTLDELWNNGAPMALPIKGEPACRLQLDPKHGLITLVTAYDTPEPDVAKLKNVGFSRRLGGRRRARRTHCPSRRQRARRLRAARNNRRRAPDRKHAARRCRCCGVARHRNVFAARGAMTTEKEVGLLGELLFLEFLIHPDRRRSCRVCMARPAVRGARLHLRHDPYRGEDDEQRTPSARDSRTQPAGAAERRAAESPFDAAHPELAPSGGRTLPKLVAQSAQISGGHQVAIDAMLTAFGWQDDDADFTRRSGRCVPQPRAYGVKDDFPAMTPIGSPVVPNFALLSDVSYRVDLTDLNHDALPDPTRRIRGVKGELTEMTDPRPVWADALTNVFVALKNQQPAPLTTSIGCAVRHPQSTQICRIRS